MPTASNSRLEYSLAPQAKNVFFLSFFGNGGVLAVVWCADKAAEGDTYRLCFIIYGLYFIELLEPLVLLESPRMNAAFMAGCS